MSGHKLPVSLFASGECAGACKRLHTLHAPHCWCVIWRSTSPHCVITLKLPRQAHGKFCSSTAAAFCSETLSIIRFCVFASLVLQSHDPQTSAVWKQSTHPLLPCSFHIPGSRLEQCFKPGRILEGGIRPGLLGAEAPPHDHSCNCLGF